MTSATSVTGNLGGLAGADATCLRLATAAGERQHIWRAYLSVERDPANNNRPTHARDRIGTGPWYNAGLQLIANSVAELHSRTGDAALFVDERGQRINGQWTGSPSPNQHDILTGSNADGTVLRRHDLRGLDVRFGERQRGRSDIRTGWDRTRARPAARVLELRSCQPELREHGAWRRSGQVLLFRGAVTERYVPGARCYVLKNTCDVRRATCSNVLRAACTAGVSHCT